MSLSLLICYWTNLQWDIKTIVTVNGQIPSILISETQLLLYVPRLCLSCGLEWPLQKIMKVMFVHFVIEWLRTHLILNTCTATSMTKLSQTYLYNHIRWMNNYSTPDQNNSWHSVLIIRSSNTYGNQKCSSVTVLVKLMLK